MVSADIELLCRLLKRDSLDNKNILNSQLTTYFPTFFLQGSPRERFLVLVFSPTGFSYHGISRDTSYGNRPPRETYPRENSHHGNSRDCLYTNRSSRGNLPAVTLPAGTSRHGNSQDFCNLIFCPDSVHREISPGVNRAIFLLGSLYPLLINTTFARTIDVDFKHSILRVGTAKKQQQQNLTKQKHSLPLSLVHYSRSQTMTASHPLTKRRGRFQ